MESKTIMFVKSWMEPLRRLDLAQRWNVVEAIMAYDSTGEIPELFSAMESLAFTFIRAEIDRMKTRYREVCDKRREAANNRKSKRNGAAASSDSETARNENAGCNCISDDAYDYNKDKEEKEEETENETEKKKELRQSRSSKRSSKKISTSSSSSSYDDSMLLDMFFAPENQDRVAAIAKIHNLPESEIRRMAEEITAFWGLTDKMHSTYKDASSHLVFSISDQVERERRQAL